MSFLCTIIAGYVACSAIVYGQVVPNREVSVAHHSPDQSHVWLANPDLYGRSSNEAPCFNISVPILEYHQADYIAGNSIGLKDGQFASELKWLVHHDYHTINFGQLYAALYRGYALPPHPVVLTFDDGYESVYKKAFPVLKKYHAQATVFMVSGYVGLHGTWRMLSSDELREMQASGLVDIESHTVHHRDMAHMPATEANTEMKDSAQQLANIVGHPIRYFCYPSGHHNAQQYQLLQQSGYLLAVVQGHQAANLRQGAYALHRMVVYETTPLSSFAAMLQQVR